MLTNLFQTIFSLSPLLLLQLNILLKFSRVTAEKTILRYRQTETDRDKQAEKETGRERGRQKRERQRRQRFAKDTAYLDAVGMRSKSAFQPPPLLQPLT